ncbi:MAG: DUF479 domain-containing protein [Bacteroidetes bacterium]|nr:DUF479 domain-containing protein [Bacteroidota bacterium]
MNYLAHAYLSFDDPEILVGNMISDFVKGKKKFDFAFAIQQGINLHRSIDNFTDAHKITKEAKEYFRPHYRLYAGAFVDVVFDHFLATDENLFSEHSLLEFSQSVYQRLESFVPVFPERFRYVFDYMKKDNWLFHYSYRWGIEKSLGGVVRRSAYLTESETAYHIFEEHYEVLKQLFGEFWPDLYSFALSQYELFKTQ